MKSIKLKVVVFTVILTLCISTVNSFALTKTYQVEINDSDIEYVTLTTIYKDETLGIESFDDFNTDNFSSVFHSISSQEIAPGQTGAALTVNIDSLERVGTYLTKLTYVYGDPQLTYSQYDELFNLSDEMVSSMIFEVYKSENPLEEMETLVSYDMLNKDNYNSAKLISNFNDLFNNIKEEMYADGYSGIEQLENHLAQVVALNSFITLGDNDLHEYIINTDLSILFDTGVDKSLITRDAFTKYFVQSRGDSITNIETLKSAVIASCGVMLMQNATPEKKLEVLQKYAGALNIDLTLAEDRGIALIQIARQIEGDSVHALQASYALVIENILAEREDDDEGTSGGGGGGGISTVYASEVKQKQDTTDASEAGQPQDETEKAEETAESVKNAIFADVPANHWAAEAVYSLADKNIISNEATVYRADDNISRAEFLKMIVLAFGMEMKGDDVSFADALKEDWYYPYIVAGYNGGIIKGISDTYFGANDAISREDAAVIAQRVLGSVSISDEPLTYTDADIISDYAQSAVTTMTDFGVINGFDDGSFRPSANITRAEAAAVIYRLSQKK